MKNLVFSGLFLATVGVTLYSCKKEITPNTVSNGDEVENYTEKVMNGVNYSAAQRSYKWVENNTKLDCSAAGKGCTVKTVRLVDNEELDLTVMQAITLIDAGDANLNQFIVQNDLSFEFPALYETAMFKRIQNGSARLEFEFPYLKVKSVNGTLLEIFNYESTVEDNEVTSRINGVGTTTYTKKISVQTDPGQGPWKCTEAGDNCKVSAIKFDVNWISNHPEYIYIPGGAGQAISEIVKDVQNKKVLVRTEAGLEYGIEL